METKHKNANIENLDQGLLKGLTPIHLNILFTIRNTGLIRDPLGDEQVYLITRALKEMMEVAKRRTNSRIHDRINIVI